MLRDCVDVIYGLSAVFYSTPGEKITAMLHIYFKDARNVLRDCVDVIYALSAVFNSVPGEKITAMLRVYFF